MQIANRAHLKSFITLDRSTIRELAGPAWTKARCSFAGRGRMRLGAETSDLLAGDCIVIPPGTRHKLWAALGGDLVLLCHYAPAYSDDDTEMTESPATE
jgi:hypothetical protein